MLNLPTDPRTAAFKAVVRRLRDDPILSRADVVKGWRNQPYEAPAITADKLPYIVIGLKAGPVNVGSPKAMTHVMSIGIDYVVSAMGTDEPTAWEDVINLYGQIEKAINPAGGLAWLRDAIHAVDPTAVLMGDPTFTQAGYTTIPYKPGFNALGGSAVLSLSLKIDTCRSKP